MVLWLDMCIAMLVVVYIILFGVYLFMGIDTVEESIGIGYTKKHLRLWFSISIIEAVIIGWMYIAHF